MTVSSIVPVNNYSGNGSTTIFDFDFLIESSDELLVTYINEKGEIKKLKEGVDYSINEIGNEFGSYITFPLEQSSYNILKQNEVISLALNLEIKQESEFENSSYLNLKVLEWTFDYIVRLIQMINRKVDRAVKTYEGSAVSPDELIENLIQARNDAEIFSDNAQDNANIAGQKLTEIENIYAEATAEIENLHSSSIDDIQSDLTDALADINNAKSNAVSVCEQKIEEAKEYSDEILNSLEEVQDVLDIANNKANLDLSNITSTAYDNLNQSKALATGDVSTNSIVYSDILNYAHSTFDLSKFTVVGSPTISDDGIITNTSNLNCVLVNNIDLRTANTWEIDLLINIQDTDLSNNICLVFNTDNRLVFQISTDLKISLFINVGTQNISFYSNTNIIQQGSNKVKLKYDSSSGYNIFVNDIQVASNTTTSKTTANGSFYIGGGYSTLTMNEPNSIDLKSFAIWVDGVPVFNGNITGTDTINEIQIPYTLSKTGSKIVDVAYRDRVQDLYSQTGEALYYTIDEKNQNFTLPMGEVYGIITNLQDNSANTSLTNLTNGLANVLCTTAPIDVEKDYGVSIIGSLTNNNNVLSGFSTSNYARINTNFAPESNTWEMNFLVTTGDNVTSNQTVCATSSESIEMGLQSSKFNLRINSGSTYNGTYTVLTNTTYYIKVQFTGSQYILSYSLNGSSYNQDITISLATVINSDTTIYIGKDYNNNSQPWLGSINLTGCNILVNNSQIWQGIAPSSSSTASSQNPAVVIENYLNGTSGYRVWSDGYCEQWGYLSPVNQNISYGISLLKSYKDNNYNVSACAVYEGYYTATAWIYSKTMNSFQLAGQRWADSGYTGIVTGVMWKTEGYIS